MTVKRVHYITPSDTFEDCSPDHIEQYLLALREALEEQYPDAEVMVESKSIERTLVSWHGGTNDEGDLIHRIAERVWDSSKQCVKCGREIPRPELAAGEAERCARCGDVTGVSP